MSGLDQGFAMQPPPQAADLQGAMAHIAGRMGPDSAPGLNWGGQHFTDPVDLYHWEQRHGNRQGFDQFFAAHPGAANALGYETVQAPGGVQNEGAMRRALISRMRGRQPGAGNALQHALGRMMLRRARG
jgi:hypothetical protein